MSVTRSQRAPRRAHRRRHQRLARPDPAQHDLERRAPAHGRGGLAARRDLQPGDLREGDPRLARLRHRARVAGARGADRARGLSPHGGARRPARLRRAAPRLRGVGRRGRLRLARGRAAARPRHGGHARAGAPVLGARRPPERDDQDPRDGRGGPGRRAGALRGPQRQRHAAVRGQRLRAHHGGVRPRDGAPPRGGQAARSPLGRLVLRLARGHRGRQAPRGARPHRARRARGPRQRPRRLPRLPARLRGRALRAAARGGLPGPAPAVGLDRGQEPAVPGDALRRRPRRPAHGQHDAAADAAGDAPVGRGDRRDGGRRPAGRPRRAARGGHRPRRRHGEAAARRHRGLHGADGEAARRHRAQARGGRHRAPGRRSRPTCRRSSSSRWPSA